MQKFSDCTKNKRKRGRPKKEGVIAPKQVKLELSAATQAMLDKKHTDEICDLIIADEKQLRIFISYKKQDFDGLCDDPQSNLAENVEYGYKIKNSSKILIYLFYNKYPLSLTIVSKIFNIAPVLKDIICKNSACFFHICAVKVAIPTLGDVFKKEKIAKRYHESNVVTWYPKLEILGHLDLDKKDDMTVVEEAQAYSEIDLAKISAMKILNCKNR